MPYEAAAALAKCVARASVSRLKSYSMVFGNPGIIFRRPTLVVWFQRFSVPRNG